jgi:hypothetical protein
MVGAIHHSANSSVHQTALPLDIVEWPDRRSPADMHAVQMGDYVKAGLDD